MQGHGFGIGLFTALGRLVSSRQESTFGVCPCFHKGVFASAGAGRCCVPSINTFLFFSCTRVHTLFGSSCVILPVISSCVMESFFCLVPCTAIFPLSGLRCCSILLLAYVGIPQAGLSSIGIRTDPDFALGLFYPTRNGFDMNSIFCREPPFPLPSLNFVA